MFAVHMEGTGQDPVSPGLRSRPSLSELHRAFLLGLHVVVSPGLRSRPSLSVDDDTDYDVFPGECRRDYGPGLR